MARKYPFSMWVYNDISEFTPDEVDLWVECGMTIPLTPAVNPGGDVSVLIPFLNRAEQLGVKMIGNVWGLGYGDLLRMGEEAYEKHLGEVLAVIGGHPALYGLCVGDEPDSAEQMDATKRCIAIQKRMAPHLVPYINYTGHTVGFSREQRCGYDLGGWMKHVAEETGSKEFCFDIYDQTINEGEGKSGFMKTVRDMVEAADYAGCEAWGCLLSSAHHVFHAQSEIDLLWQINAAATMGLKGVLWFRFYDRASVIEYCGSPIDEFGNKTEAYYGMMRAQRRFNNHYGEIFMRLRHKKTYEVKSDRGVFPEFRPGDHELIKAIEPNDETMVSFFEDEDGTEYMVLFHTVIKYYGVVKVRFDDTKCDLYKITNNGADESRCRNHDGEDEGNTILPASIAMYKIVRK